jgi:uncharacterized protein with von Willebrand factor type A (vWA) domain
LAVGFVTMRHRYLYLDPELINSLLASLDLLRLFNQLLIAAAGNAEQAREWMRDLQARGYIDDAVDLEAFFAKLEEQGVLGRDRQGSLQLTTSGARQLRRSALDEIFSNLKKAGPGYHPIPAAGEGAEQLPEQSPTSSAMSCMRSMGLLDRQCPHVRTASWSQRRISRSRDRHLTSCATVIAIDISHSMVLYGEDRITPAKTVALALTELMTSKYQKDYLGVLVFGDRASRIELSDIAGIQAGPFHTNVQALGWRVDAASRKHLTSRSS